MLQVHLVFPGNIPTIQTFFYRLFIDLMCIFHAGIILHKLGISLPQEDGFIKVKDDYEDSAYYSECDEYGVDPTESWMYGD